MIIAFMSVKQDEEYYRYLLSPASELHLNTNSFNISHRMLFNPCESLTGIGPTLA